MQKIRVDLGERSYNITIDAAILRAVGQHLKRFEFSNKIAMVSNPTVYSLYGEPVASSIRNAGFELIEVSIPDGEEYKNLESVSKIYEQLLTTRLDRKSALIALGGGVIGDMTGFAAATYMRGIDFIQIPTTLLAQVDSSVGGKTGVNHKLGKNMIGSFWQPRAVFIDLDTLATLPKKELLAGLAEVIKYGVIWDSDLFAFLESSRDEILSLDRRSLEYIIKKSCEIKAEVVSKDERESGLRAILNYGHTIGHAVETVTGYTKFLHGEAVAIGMHHEAVLAEMCGLISGEEVERIRALIDSYGLPFEMPDECGTDKMMSTMKLDKKAVAGDMKFILPERIGKVRIESGISTEVVKKALAG